MNREIKRGDIFWVDPNPYKPAVGHMQQAGRPAIVVSNDENNFYSPTLEIVYLTTKPRRDMPTHCTIRSSNRVSTALCEQVTTISKAEQIGEYIGCCTEEEMRMVDTCIAISLGLDFATQPEKEEPCEDSTDINYVINLQKAVEHLEELLAEQTRRAEQAEVEMHRAKAREDLLMQLYKEAIDM